MPKQEYWEQLAQNYVKHKYDGKSNYQKRIQPIFRQGFVVLFEVATSGSNTLAQAIDLLLLKPHIKRFPWVMEAYEYVDTGQLLASLVTQVIEPAEAKAKELRRK